MYEKTKQQGRINKELRDKLNIIEAQTKKKVPQKRQPKPQDERPVVKKNEIELKKYRKVILNARWSVHEESIGTKNSLIVLLVYSIWLH